MIVILGATGHTGSIVAEKLLGTGAKVRVVSRNTKSFEKFTQKGAEAVSADLTDATAADRAFSGARSAYILAPPSISEPDVRAYQERVTDNIAAAIRKNGIAHAVVLSSTGADRSQGVGPVVGLHNLEQKLNAIQGLNSISLRAGYFMENVLAQVNIISSLGFMGSPLRGDLPLPMIATRDIGAVAAELLAKPDFTGKQTRELLGPRHVTYSEVAKIVGSAIGKPDLTYRHVPGAQVKPAMMGLGMSSSMADLIIEMCEALNSGSMKSQEARSPRNTTPTTIETFVAEAFVPAFRGKAARA
jgi:uncharacterized protein YbjT (DUF2867 family)